MGYDDLLQLALERGKWCFTPDAFPTVGNGYRLACLDMSISQVFNRAGSGDGPNSLPVSTEDFLTKSSCVFSPAFSAHLREKFNTLDVACGQPVADGFMSLDTIISWTSIITWNTLGHYLAIVEKEDIVEEEGKKKPTEKKPPQFDGTEEGPLPLKEITQITLRGTTISQAWADNEAVKEFTGFDRHHLPNWSPSVPGRAPVFRDTSTHLETPEWEQIIDHELSTNPTALGRVRGKAQLFPESNDCQGIYTSFSALRSFLWAVFHGEVIQDPPRPTALAPATLLKCFRMRNQDFRGILLLMFSSQQPTPQGMSSYQVPAGQEAAWLRAVNFESRYKSSSRNAWTGHLKEIHGKDTASFPDIIHGRDLPTLRAQLRAFPCNQALLWQTAWMSEDAASSLNRGIVGIYAISFEEITPLAKKMRKRGKVGTLGRKLGEGLKEVLRKMCG